MASSILIASWLYPHACTLYDGVAYSLPNQIAIYKICIISDEVTLASYITSYKNRVHSS